MVALATRLDFADTDLLEQLETGRADPDDAPFGIVGLDRDARVLTYNAYESRAAGLSRDSVIGEDFFASVAPCMNNFMVAQRFLDGERLDETLDYVLTLRMRPTRVKLRLLKSPNAARSYILIQRI